MPPVLRRLSPLLAALFVLAAPLAAAGDPRAAVPPPRRLLLVSIDGLSPRAYVDPDAAGLAVPTLRALAARGAWSSGVSGVLPACTYPAHTTLVTGVPPRVHGILGNAIFDPLEIAGGAWHWYARDVRVPSLLTAAYGAGRITGAVWWPVTVGLEIDALVPEFWRRDSTHPDDRKLADALSSPGLFAEVEERLGAPLRWPPTDHERAELALHVLHTRRPHLMLVHFADHDHAQHVAGPASPEARAALEAIDGELARLLSAIEELGLAPETLVAVVSDHGFLPVTRELAPNTLLVKEGLIELDRDGHPHGWRARFWEQDGSTLLRLADPADAATLARVRGLVERRAAEPGSGIRAVLTGPEIHALGGDPAVTPLALDAREGFLFTDRTTGPWSAPAGDLGAHGFAPVRPEMDAALLVAGPGLSRRGDLGVVPMTRIAPTLARWLGIALAPEAEPPLDWVAAP